MVSIGDLLEGVHGLFKEPIIGPLKSKVAEIRHLENRHDVIFSTEGGAIWIKFIRLVQNDMSTAVIWSESKPDVEFQYGGRLGEFHGMSSHSHLPHCRVPGEFSVMIPELRVTLQGAATGKFNGMSSQSHMPHCRVQSPGKISVMIVAHFRV